MRNWIGTRRLPRPAAPQTHLSLESLEERAVPSNLPLSPPAAPAVATVFVESNNPAPGQNAVLAFSRGADGTLTQIGTFSTHGTGHSQ